MFKCKLQAQHILSPVWSSYLVHDAAASPSPTIGWIITVKPRTIGWIVPLPDAVNVMSFRPWLMNRVSENGEDHWDCQAGERNPDALCEQALAAIRWQRE
jgi:hypothetical protein